MNVSKLPARRIGREKQTKEFDQTVSKHGRTVFEKNRGTDYIRTISRPSIKAREGNEIVIMKNIYLRDGVIRGWKSIRNMLSIIQSRVGRKGLSEESRFRERRDNCGAVWLK